MRILNELISKAMRLNDVNIEWVIIYTSKKWLLYEKLYRQIIITHNKFQKLIIASINMVSNNHI